MPELSAALDDATAGSALAGTEQIVGLDGVDLKTWLASQISTFVLASAALTGTPTAPTAAPGTNTTQLATTAFVIAAITGLLDWKGDTDCSSNPNYPAASKGDAYIVTVAGKIGGASGKSVDIGDVFVAKADNAGGTEAAVGTSWFVLEHNLAGALLAANNLSDLASAGTARTNLGLALGVDLPDYFFIRLDADYTLTSTTAVQQLFNTTANGRLTLATGLYKVSGVFKMTGMSATLGNAAFSLAGTAVLAGQMLHVVGGDRADVATPANVLSGQIVNGASAFNTDMLSATGGAQLGAMITGMFRVTTGGTVIPSIALTTAAAAVVEEGSWLEVERIADLGTNSKGAWD